MTDAVDCVVIGAGAVGLAVARAIARTGREVLVAEAAAAIGTGASSRNSEVIHAGIYYPAGSQKARLCVAGKLALYKYCAAKGVPHRRVGKIIVATAEAEVPNLAAYKNQAAAGGVRDLRWLTPVELARIEPAVRAVRGLLSPSSGILDSHAYLLALLGDLEDFGGQLALNSPVETVRRDAGGYLVVAGGGELRCRWLVNAAGLDAPAVAGRIAGLDTHRVPPAYYAIGHYYTLTGPSPFRHLVYPQASDGGLGIHVTLDLAGKARFGPDLRWMDRVDYAFDDRRRDAFLAAIRRYYPGLDEARLQPAYTGIRSKISGPGEAAADFLLQCPADHGLPGLVNLFDIESPGLTASLAIADWVCETLAGA